MPLQSTAGTTLGISTTAPATFNAAGYNALTFVNVGEITDLGEFGREYNLITHNPIDTRATKKLKGSFNEGQMAMTVALDTDDAGQVICKTASQSDADFYIKVVAQNGDKYFFPAKVMSFKRSFGSVDNVVTASINLEITSATGGVGVVEDLVL